MLDLKLVPYQHSFLESAIAWRSQLTSLRHNPIQVMTKAEVATMLESAGSDLSDLRKYETYTWFVALGVDVVGSVSLKNISHSMGYAEIGYGIGEKHHAKGIGTASVKLLVDKIFTETALRRLMAFVHDENRPSCRVLEKSGFRREGLLREHYMIHGAPVNEVLYALLRYEWLALKAQGESRSRS